MFHCPEDKKIFLLLATQRQKNHRVFSFAYWIPKSIYNPHITLLDIFQVFINSFGFQLKIGNEEGYFIQFSRKLTMGKIKNPMDLIESKVPIQIPTDFHFFSNENIIGNLNYVNIYYAYSLNTGKYIFWLKSFSYVALKIRKGWQDYVQKNLIDYVQPEGNTVIKVHKQEKNSYLDEDISNDYSEISVPTIYERKFKYIFNEINNLKNNEKIIFSLSLNSPQCLFCQSKDLSKEHIFPKWIRPYLKEKIFKGSTSFDFGNEDFKNLLDSSTSLGKKENSHGFTTKIVCIDCNNNWLSNLEKKVKEILVENDKLKSSLKKINEKDSKILSRWIIIKTLLLSNKMHSNSHEFQQLIFNNLREGEIPNGFIVECVTAENKNFDFTVSKGVIRDENIETDKFDFNKAKEILNNLYISCVQFNNLIFRVSFLDPDIPFERATKFVKTKILHPLNKDIEHYSSVPLNKKWKAAVEKKLEMHILSFGLNLKEKR